MTVAAEIAQPNVRLEFFVAIEGVGWPSSLTDLSAAWDGDIFTTTDWAGTLESDLGLSSGELSRGLMLPGGVSEEFDPRTLRFKSGSMSFTIIDHDDKLVSKIVPENTNGATGELYEDTNYNSTTFTIDNADRTWANDDLVWISDSELVRLKNRALSAGTIYNYTSCDRAVFGTVRGRIDDSPIDADNFAWIGSNSGNGFATRIRTWLRRWYNKRMVLFAKVPGEARGNSVILYQGRIRSIATVSTGNGFRFNTTSETVTGPAGKIRRKPPSMSVVSDGFVTEDGTKNAYFVGAPQGADSAELPVTSISDYQVASELHRVEAVPTSESQRAHYQMAYQYQYRQWVAGGTAGVRTALNADPTAPQAYQDSQSRYIIGSMVSVDGNALEATYKFQNDDYRTFGIQAANWHTGSVVMTAFEKDATVDFMLDNVTDSIKRSRWVINGEITRNPIDVMLAFMTSTNNEHARISNSVISSIANATLADGRAATRITLVAAQNWDTDEWIGYGLHFVTGANAGYMSEIVDNSATVIDVVPRLPSTTNNGQFHIRNTIYDILPIGWGLGIHNKNINIAAFEAIRDKYLDGSEIGRFAIGDKDDIDVWDLILENICSIYGILVYHDRFNGKITARYIGDRAIPDGVDETYPTISTSQILDIGEIDYMPRPQISAIKLKVRDSSTVSIRPYGATRLLSTGERRPTGYADDTVSSVGDDNKTAVITIQEDEGEVLFQNDVTETIEYNAMFHSEDTSADLVARMVSRLNRERIPDPEVDIELDLSLLTTVQPGAVFSITENTKFKPIDPFTGTRGWTGVLALVKSVAYSFNSESPGINARLILLTSTASKRIAPAVDVSSKGNDAGGDYFVVPDYGSSVYASDNNVLDWANFAVDDVIELRNEDGTTVETETIKGFGSNLASEPANASNPRIYVDGTISAAITSGDYLSFQPYTTASSTANMKAHVALADSNETIDADTANKYA